MRELTEAKVRTYLDTTRRGLEKAKHASPTRSFLRKAGDDFRHMAESYYKDGLAFLEKSDLVNAFACANYAHGWLDAGARLGLFDVGGDDQLFTLYE